ncbi:MAG: family 10 glycosylhydrolase [Pirellulales bacterium]
MKSCRKLTCCFVVIGIELATLVGNHRLAAAPDSAVTSSPSAATAIKELRRKASDRRRRIIINNDGNDTTRGLPQVTEKNLLDERTTMLAGTQVDCLCYCPQSVGLDVFTHFTKIGTIFTAQEDIFAENQMQEFVEKGIDPLRVMIDFGKQHDIEVFWSMRMNDTHDASSHEYGRVLLQANRFKAAHPEYMLGTAKSRPKHGAWTALDYGRPEVRERVFRLVEEVCLNYDIDGVELDFFRHPVFFQSTSRGEQVTDEERAAMTELMARIRKMADEVGQSRGRPILIAVRTPDSAEYCRAIGLDLERWMADDLIDLYLPAGYFQLNEWDESVALGHKYGVKVYPSLDESRVRDESGRTKRTTNRAFRARAADAWRAGADGIYLFNFPEFHKTDNSLLREMGSPQVLASLDKDYFGSVRGVVNAAGGNLPYGPYMKLETLNPDNPKKIQPGATATARISLSEDVQQSAPGKLKLRLKVLGVPADQRIRVALNGKRLVAKPVGDGWFESVPASSNLRAGRNTVAVALPTGANQAATWSDAVLEVRQATDR